MLRIIASALILNIFLIGYSLGETVTANATEKFPPQPTLPTSSVAPNITTLDPSTTVPPNTTTTEPPTTTSAAPNTTTTTAPKTSTVAPNITTIAPNVTTTAAPNTTTTTLAPSTSTSPTTVPPGPTNATTVSPTSTKPPHSTTEKPDHPSDRKFDAFSFLGGFSLAFGLVAIGFLSWKFYMSRQENIYHTL